MHSLWLEGPCPVGCVTMLGRQTEAEGKLVCNTNLGWVQGVVWWEGAGGTMQPVVVGRDRVVGTDPARCYFFYIIANYLVPIF